MEAKILWYCLLAGLPRKPSDPERGVCERETETVQKRLVPKVTAQTEFGERTTLVKTISWHRLCKEKSSLA